MGLPGKYGEEKRQGEVGRSCGEKMINKGREELDGWAGGGINGRAE